VTPDIDPRCLQIAAKLRPNVGRHKNYPIRKFEGISTQSQTIIKNGGKMIGFLNNRRENGRLFRKISGKIGSGLKK
jgi:hypothetical protein